MAFSLNVKVGKVIHVCILDRVWARDDFESPFLDIKGCVSLSIYKAPRFIVGCSSLWEVLFW